MKTKAIRRAAVLLLALLICVMPCAMADDTGGVSNNTIWSGVAAPTRVPSEKASVEPTPTPTPLLLYNIATATMIGNSTARPGGKASDSEEATDETSTTASGGNAGTASTPDANAGTDPASERESALAADEIPDAVPSAQSGEADATSGALPGEADETPDAIPSVQPDEPSELDGAPSEPTDGSEPVETTNPDLTPEPTPDPNSILELEQTPPISDGEDFPAISEGEEIPTPSESEQASSIPEEEQESPIPEEEEAPTIPKTEPTLFVPEAEQDISSDSALEPATQPAVSAALDDAEYMEEQTAHGDGSGLVLTSNKPKLGWTGVVPASDGGMPIPRMYQYNYKTVLCYYNGAPRSVSTSGCNVTCVAMVSAYLTGEKYSPEKLFSWALKNDLYSGNGLGHSEMSRVAANYGVSGSWIGRDGDAVVAALKAGKPVIAHMGPGLFTRRGHYIVLRGVTEDGKILVNDPNSSYKSGLAYPMSTILREARTGAPFMVCG